MTYMLSLVMIFGIGVIIGGLVIINERLREIIQLLTFINENISECKGTKTITDP